MEGRVEHEHGCWDERRSEGIPARGIAGNPRDVLRLDPRAWMQIRNLSFRFECPMSPLVVSMAQGWPGYAARGTSRELLLPLKRWQRGRGQWAIAPPRNTDSLQQNNSFFCFQEYSSFQKKPGRGFQKSRA